MLMKAPLWSAKSTVVIVQPFKSVERLLHLPRFWAFIFVVFFQYYLTVRFPFKLVKLNAKLFKHECFVY